MGLLRFFLASSVLLVHSASSFQPLHAGAAVSAFYVISGFYMQLLFAEKYRRGDALPFYKSRALRILPVYYLFALVSLPFASDVLRQTLAAENLRTIAFVILENLFIFGQDFARFFVVRQDGGLSFSGTGLPASSLPILGQSWSLAVEFGFYAVAPFLLHRSTRVLAAVLACSIVVRLVVAFFDPGRAHFSNAWYAFLPSEIGTFLLGSLAYRFYATARMPKAGPYMLALIVVYCLAYPVLSKFCEPAAYFGFVLLVAVSAPQIFAWTRDSKIDRWIGELSYPIYLGHIFVLTLVTMAGIESKAVPALILTTLLAVALARYVDAPITRFRLASLKLPPLAPAAPQRPQ